MNEEERNKEEIKVERKGRGEEGREVEGGRTKGRKKEKQGRPWGLLLLL